MTDIGTVVDGKYEILKEIGRGGMSVVYLAMDLRLNKQWAVKEIKKKGSGKNDEIVVNSLLAEANLMKKLDHPSLPRIVDIIDNGVTIYVVMDYIEGESLDKILEEYGAQSEDLVIGWAKQLCDALGYLHSQKPPIIYRDMKPGNIMLKPEGNIKIIDFGIAREYKEQNLADTTVLGTKGYAPPEQYSGQTDPRSDIFALGMTMHHLLTGVDPRSGEVYAPVRQWNPNLSEGIEIIIDKCTQPAPENRYQTCAELLYDLEHPDLITRGYKKKQKKRLRGFIIAAAVFIIALAGAFVCGTLSDKINENTYEELLNQNSIESYEEAIEINPSRTEAYKAILEYYNDSGTFGPDESAVVQAIFSTIKSNVDTDTVEYAELNYMIGKMYFNYYTDEDGESASTSEKVSLANQYFTIIHENKDRYAELYAELESEDKEEIDFDSDLAECYYQICSSYKTYILSSANVEEPSLEVYEELFETVETTLAGTTQTYEKIAFCNFAFLLIYDQRNTIAQVGIEEDYILDLFDSIYETAAGLTAYKSVSQTLQEEILDNYTVYRAEIVNTYANNAQRSTAAAESKEEE